MSEISRELQEQMGNVGKVFEKLFPEGPAIDTGTEREKALVEERRRALEEKLAGIARIREHGSSY
jgi:hypothetical protein